MLLGWECPILDLVCIVYELSPLESPPKWGRTTIKFILGKVAKALEVLGAKEIDLEVWEDVVEN